MRDEYGERDGSCSLGINADMSANHTRPRPVVHLELHTSDQVRAQLIRNREALDAERT